MGGPALRAAQKEDIPAAECLAQADDDITTSTTIPSPLQRERSRSWSPPPETIRAASVAGQQASSAAVARGLSSEQAEAIGAAAAQDLLKRTKEEANLPKQGGNHHASVDNAARKSSDRVAVGAATTTEKKPCKSLEHVQIGDSVQAVGLKGKDEELNGETFVIRDFRGWGGPRKRKYVVSTTRLIIDAQGDPAEEKKVMTLPAKNIRLPGDQTAYEDSNGSSDSSKASKRSRKKSRSKRSRSRRRRRRSSSSSSSSSGKRKPTMRPRGEPAPAMTKAQRLARFNFLPPGQKR